MQVLDVGHNHLMNVSVTNLMASQINLLDMSLNAGLKVDPRELKTIRCAACRVVGICAANSLVLVVDQRREV